MSEQLSAVSDLGLKARLRTSEVVVTLLAVPFLFGYLCSHLLGRVWMYSDEVRGFEDYRGVFSHVFVAENGYYNPFARFSFNLTIHFFGANYAPHLFIAGVLHGLVVAFVYLLVAQRRGRGWALGLALLIGFMGTAFHVFFWPAAAYLSAADALVLGALCIRAQLTQRSSRWWLGGVVLAMILVTGMSGSFGVIASVTVALCLGIAGTRRTRAWLFTGAAACTVFYLHGVLFLASTQYPSFGDRAVLARDVVESPAAAGGLIADGLQKQFSPSGSSLSALVFLIPLALCLAWAVGEAFRQFSSRQSGLPRERAAIADLSLLFFAFLSATAISAFRAHLGEGAAPRYLLHLCAGLLVFVVIELPSAAAWASPRLPHAVAPVTAAFLLLGFSTNLGQYMQSVRNERYVGAIERAILTSIEIARGVTPPDFRPGPDPAASLPYLVAGQYFSAVDRLGSPAVSEQVLVTLSGTARQAADRIQFDLGVAAIGGVSAPSSKRSCRALATGDHVGAGSFILASIEGGVVSLRRYAPGADPRGTTALGAGEQRSLIIKAVGVAPWIVAVTGDVALCSS